MSTVSDLRITVNNVNRLLEDMGATPRVRVTRSYNRVRLEIDEEGGGTRSTRPIGPKDCLMYAEGMERALETIVYGR